MLFKPNVMVVNQDKRKVGRIPVGVARELINTRVAKVIRNRPAILELTPNKKPASGPIRPAIQPKINSLKNIVDIASRFTGNKRHIMANILLKIDDGKLYVGATDLESSFYGHVGLNNKYLLSHDTGVNSICINPEKLKKLLPLTEGVVDVHIQKKDDVFGLKIGEFFLEGESADGFPATQTGEGARFTITNIANKLSFVGSALSTVKSMSALCGVCFDLKNNNLAGADGSRLHFVPLTENTKQKKIDACAIVPPRILSVSKYLNGNIRLIQDKKKEIQSTIFELNIPGCIQCYATYTNIEWQYPNYIDVVPTGYKNKFTTRTGDIIPSLRKVKVSYTDDTTPVARFEFGAETKVVSAKTGYNTIVNGNYTGNSFTAQVNLNHLLDCIQTLPPGEIEIHLADENDKGWLVKGLQGFTGVIMPIES